MVDVQVLGRKTMLETTGNVFIKRTYRKGEGRRGVSRPAFKYGLVLE